jgi:hypothetical protein
MSNLTLRTMSSCIGSIPSKRAQAAQSLCSVCNSVVALVLSYTSWLSGGNMSAMATGCQSIAAAAAAPCQPASLFTARLVLLYQAAYFTQGWLCCTNLLLLVLPSLCVCCAGQTVGYGSVCRAAGSRCQNGGCGCPSSSATLWYLGQSRWVCCLSASPYSGQLGLARIHSIHRM